MDFCVLQSAFQRKEFFSFFNPVAISVSFHAIATTTTPEKERGVQLWAFAPIKTTTEFFSRNRT